MNTHLSPLRTVAALGAALTLTLAACGGDDDSSESTDAPAATDPPAATDAPAATPAMQPASITAEAQDSDGTTIVIASIDLPAPGFVAVHGDGGGSPGPVIGVSDLLPAGTSTGVSVTLTDALTADATVYPMVHIDTDSNGVYEFGIVEGADGPGVTADGDVTVVPADITLGAGDEDAAGATITIADFSFGGVTEVATGTTVVVTNTDGTPHTWSAVDGTFDSGSLGSGDTFEFTFTEAGEFEYFCNFHPSMQGTIVVTG